MEHVDTGVLFKDLEIPVDSMLSDPLEFAAQVLSKGRELQAVCKQDTSVSALTNQVKNESGKVDVPPTILAQLNDLYGKGDEISLPELSKFIEAAQALVNDLKNTLRDRVIREATSENSTVQDKRFAHMQYVRLRKAYEAFRTLHKILGTKNPETMAPINLPVMPALPGNYGGSYDIKWPFFTIKGQTEGYYNYRAVAKEIGLENRFDRLGDFLDWCNSVDNDIVEVREVVR